MASGESQPLSLRPVPIPDADKKPKTIADFIGRINSQPGGFRSVTEEQLNQEIEEEEERRRNGVDEDVDMSVSDGDGAEDEDERDPAAVRMEVLKNIE
jgi:mediator of RNA polymerase II transcription subunit 17